MVDGELPVSLGQLLRDELGGDGVFLLGTTTARGTVAAASARGLPAQVMTVPDAVGDSHEGAFHATGIPPFYLPLHGEDPAQRSEPRLHRRIGSSDAPSQEREHHYVLSVLPDAYDGIVHIDVTSAVTPLEPFRH